MELKEKLNEFLSVKRTPAQIRAFLKRNGVEWELSEIGKYHGDFDIIITYPKIAPMARIYKPRYSNTYILQLWREVQYSTKITAPMFSARGLFDGLKGF